MVDRVFQAGQRPNPGRNQTIIKRRADEQVARSFQVLGQQFQNIMDFPRVEEFIDRERQESMMSVSRTNLNMRHQSHIQENFESFKAPDNQFVKE